MIKLASTLCLLILSSLTAAAQGADWRAVEDVLGRTGTEKDGMFKITIQRTDVKVQVGDIVIEPGLALTTWIAFMPMTGTMNMGGHDAMPSYMMMGDLVLLDAEVGPVIRELMNNGLQVTALHNHIVGEKPAIKYLHFAGEGDPVRLAGLMELVISKTATPLSAPSQPAKQPEKVDWSNVEAIMGRAGTNKGMLLQFSIPRSEHITENGMELAPFMGMATALNIQMSHGKAAATGDFVLLADEVNPVVKALTDNGITVTAIHNHMLYESPRFFMVHFWVVGDAEMIARGLKAAVDRTKSAGAK